MVFGVCRIWYLGHVGYGRRVVYLKVFFYCMYRLFSSVFNVQDMRRIGAGGHVTLRFSQMLTTESWPTAGKTVSLSPNCILI